MRTRLRDLPDLATTYPTPHDHRLYGAGHDIRARVTVALGQWALADCGGHQVADLSAGQGAIARAIAPAPILGDYAPGHPIRGRIEDTIADIPRVDLSVCTETLEHLEDPDGVLVAMRGKAKRLVCSLPERDDIDTNPEHVWAFDREGGEAMLADAGWSPDAFVSVDPGPPYRYMVWCCS